MNKERQIDEALSRLQSRKLANQEEKKLDETARLREEERKKAEFERQRQKNIATLNATQIPQLLEEVAKTDLLVLKKDPVYVTEVNESFFGLFFNVEKRLVSSFTPAKTYFSEDGSSVAIRFNEREEYAGSDSFHTKYDYIAAKLGENGQIIVDGKEVPEDQTPLEAVEERVQYWIDVNSGIKR